MATCPVCGESQSLLGVIKLDKTRVICCKKCGASLAIDSQRTSILMGGFIAYLLLPATGVVPFEFNNLWFLFVVVTYFPFVGWYTKLNVVEIPKENGFGFNSKRIEEYANLRNRIRNLSKALVAVGFVLMGAGLLIKESNETTEYIMLVGVSLLGLGLFLPLATKCPFCSKITFSKFSKTDGTRCMHCHRMIE